MLRAINRHSLHHTHLQVRLVVQLVMQAQAVHLDLVVQLVRQALQVIQAQPVILVMLVIQVLMAWVGQEVLQVLPV